MQNVWPLESMSVASYFYQWDLKGRGPTARHGRLEAFWMPSAALRRGEAGITGQDVAESGVTVGGTYGSVSCVEKQDVGFSG